MVIASVANTSSSRAGHSCPIIEGIYISAFLSGGYDAFFRGECFLSISISFLCGPHSFALFYKTKFPSIAPVIYLIIRAICSLMRSRSRRREATIHLHGLNGWVSQRRMGFFLAELLFFFFFFFLWLKHVYTVWLFKWIAAIAIRVRLPFAV